MVLMPCFESASAPLYEPSPPITTTPSILCFLQTSAPLAWPSSVTNSEHLAVPKIVPPSSIISDTLLLFISTISSARSPAYPLFIPLTATPLQIAVLTTPLMAAFIPGASPPLVRTPIVLISAILIPP